MQRGLGEAVRSWGRPPRPHWRGFPHSRFASRHRLVMGEYS
ncbi:hypothetical protein [Moorena bouillonii]|nr:hypothetical protein [Moorena bouillonii]